eukprot:7122949-Lingulodinium_polyedra.AAC.1
MAMQWPCNGHAMAMLIMTIECPSHGQEVVSEFTMTWHFELPLHGQYMPIARACRSNAVYLCCSQE